MAPFKGRELYYFDTAKEFETAKSTAELYTTMQEELECQDKREVLFLCIGTDRSTGDSPGPLVGRGLQEKHLNNMGILGILDHPVHTMNLGERLRILENRYPHHLVITVDASIDRADHVGHIILGHDALKPGLGVSEELRSVGDTFTVGIVSGCDNYGPLMPQSIRPPVVMRSANCINESIYPIEKLQDPVTLA